MATKRKLSFWAAMVAMLTVSMSAADAYASEDDFLLYWQVYDPVVTQIGGSQDCRLSDFIGQSAHASSDWGVQVSVSDKNGGFVEYLSLWYSGGQDGWKPSVKSAEISSETGYGAGPTYANIGNYVFKGVGNEYSSGSYVFALEIGYYDAADNFVTQVKSESWDYNNFMSNAPVDPQTGNRMSYIQSNELQIPAVVAWTGGLYTAPEPSSGLLMALGASLLALRRRRNLKGEGAA